MSGIFGGGSSTNTVVQPNQLSPEELAFIKTQNKLATLQLQNLKGLQPFQKKLVQDALREARQDRRYGEELDKLISPKQRARLEANEIKRAKQFGLRQDELLELQLEQMRQGGRATDEQIADIKAATDAGIESGSYDIDRSTQEGLGLISDELANSRGLRMTDTPILREATLLAQEGGRQKESLIRGLRTNEANARLNYPLAVQGLQGQMNINQQQVLQNAQQFQADLRNRAFQNRMALTNTAGGLGLGNPGGQMPAIQHGSNSTMTGSTPINWGGVGTMMLGAAALSPYLMGLGGAAAGGAVAGGAAGGAALAASDRRVKDDYGVVAKTRGGLPLHLFRYKGESKDAPLRLGVMAQETERLFPDAVAEREDGLLLVDYKKVA